MQPDNGENGLYAPKETKGWGEWTMLTYHDIANTLVLRLTDFH